MLNFDLPEDIRPFVLKMQTELKKKKNLKLYSQQLTISHIIREYKKFVEMRDSQFGNLGLDASDIQELISKSLANERAKNNNK